MNYFIFIGQSESGDRIGPLLFNDEPIVSQLKEALMKDYPTEFDGDPSDWPDRDFGYINPVFFGNVDLIKILN